MTGAGSPRRHYTDEEIAAANDVDLPELLVSLGYHVKPIGRFYTTHEIDSLRVWDNRRTWYRFSRAVGGDAIALVQHLQGLSFPESVGFLLANSGKSPPSLLSRQRPRPPPQRGRPRFALPLPNGDNRRVCAYLRGRGISPGIIDDFIKAGLLYEDATTHHNAVFVGYGSAGNPVFATKRGTDSIPFKCDVAGSNKRVAFRIPYDPALDAVCVFEAPIDLMSWLTLYGRCNAVALCGLHDAPLAAYLDDYPHIGRIALCLDADAPGREAAARIGAKYGERGFRIEDRVPPFGKDWNEYLQLVRPRDANRT